MSGTARVTLRGRRILVTGGSKGIGREIALAAADAGAFHDVVLQAGPERAGPLLPRTERQIAEGGVPMRASAELAVFLVADPDLATLRRIYDQRYRRVR